MKLRRSLYARPEIRSEDSSAPRRLCWQVLRSSAQRLGARGHTAIQVIREPRGAASTGHGLAPWPTSRRSGSVARKARSPVHSSSISSCSITLSLAEPGSVGSTTLSGSLANLWQAAAVGECEMPLVLVGATGFEPVTPSVSAKHREALCSTLFSQVVSDRRCRREMLSWHTGKRSLHPSSRRP
jgi:hypothetical protein